MRQQDGMLRTASVSSVILFVVVVVDFFVVIYVCF